MLRLRSFKRMMSLTLTLKILMPRDDPDRQPFYLIVADYDRNVFAVEGLMSDDRQRQSAARAAAVSARSLATGPDRDELAAEFRREY
jgi:hypothetical protein